MIKGKTASRPIRSNIIALPQGIESAYDYAPTMPESCINLGHI